MKGSIVHSNIRVVSHHYQRFSSSQCMLQMQVQTQQRFSNALTQRMIPYSLTNLHNLQLQNYNKDSTLKDDHNTKFHAQVCLYFPTNNCFSLLKITMVFSRLVTWLSVKVWSFRLCGFYTHNIVYEQHFLSFL